MMADQRDELIRLLQKGGEISPEWARILFPPEKRQYEFVYHGKEREEDILADTLAVPLQPVRTFAQNGVDWQNIVITKDIAAPRAVAEQLQEFLEEWEKISPDQAESKVLPVTSHKDHQINVAKLKLVDQPSGKVEWIVSVAMLTEGWDVKNVFQIVPHEEKAFNSKLLIAQVLGRGLRKPLDWEGEQPLATVFNHDAWSGRIKHLVNEVLEIERRLTSSVVPSSPHNFELHQLVYDRETDTREFTKTGERNFLEKGFIGLPSQVEAEDVSVEFERVTGERQAFKSKVEHKTHTVEEVAEEIYRRLGSIDDETADAENPKDRTNYRRKFPLKQLVKIVADSLKRAGIKSGRVTEANKQKFFQSLGPLQRHKAKRGEFSPDFFIKIGDLTVVAEIKDDDEISDPAPENVKNYE